jgi:S-adenosylmethionine synthetase
MLKIRSRQGVKRQKVSEIDYTRAKFGFDTEICGVTTSIDPQPQDIAQGVDHASDAELSEDKLEKIAAGDQMAAWLEFLCLLTVLRFPPRHFHRELRGFPGPFR